MTTTWLATLFLLPLAMVANTASKTDSTQLASTMANDFNLVSWDASTSTANHVVAKDGSGDYKTINEAVKALAQLRRKPHERVVIHVKSGVYAEYVEINMTNVMFVGDGIDKTIITGNRSNKTGWLTGKSATFSVYGDGFWAKNITFENTAGPEKDQAVALKASSNYTVFYQCSFKGFQDTLYVHKGLQFYRDCHVYGTIDFIFGDATVVFQHCDIYVRKPLVKQTNTITAQGRQDPNKPTGISIHISRVMPATDFAPVKGLYKSYLGRPWHEYSRTIFMKTYIDGLIDPEGWKSWSDNSAPPTIYYGEYMNSGPGSSTNRRVNWPGFHLLSNRDALQFTVSSFIKGKSWIPETGVPFFSGL